MICSRVISRSYAIKERITPVSIQLVCSCWVMHTITHHGEEYVNIEKTMAMDASNKQDRQYKIYSHKIIIFLPDHTHIYNIYMVPTLILLWIRE